MTDDNNVIFDDIIALALAQVAGPVDLAPRPQVKQQLMARIRESVPATGFSLLLAEDTPWLPHPVPGVRMRVLAVNRDSGYATMLLDVDPGTTFPAHHHTGAEECYVISGSLYFGGRWL